MKDRPLPWFRLYHETVDDEKLGLLAFEDRWHFIAILCCKAKGILDSGKIDLVRRKLALKMGLAQSELDEVARRLSDVGLIDKKNFQPVAWEIRQFKSDISRERTRAYRDRMKRHCDVTVTAQDTDTDTDKYKSEKDPPRRKKQKEKTDSPPADAPNPDRPFHFSRLTTVPDNFHATPDMVEYADKLGYLGEPEDVCITIKLYCESKGVKYKDYHSTFKGWLRRDKASKPHLFREITEFAKMPPGFVYEPPDVEMDERCFD